MFAAAIPQPAHNLPGSALATGIRDAILAASWGAHCREHYTTHLPAKPKRAGRKPVRRVAMQTVAAVSAPAPVGALSGELVAVADAVCMILGVGPMKRAELPRAPAKPGKPSLGIGADALARIRVDEASDAWCAVVQDIPKRAAAREKARARAWKKWEGTAGALVGAMS